MKSTATPLLAPDEPSPVTVRNPNGASPLFVVADHSGNLIPRALGDLGVSEAERARHIGWDIGIAGVVRLMAEALDATSVQQNYSRLVVDCNRPPGVPSSIPDISELTPVPGNVGLSANDRDARVREIFRPYHAAIEAELDRRKNAGRATVLIAMHSFTPSYKGLARPWHAGVLYNRDPRLAHIVLALLKRDAGLLVGDMEPYTVSDEHDYTIPVHGERRGLHHVAIEIRQDLIAHEKGQQDWAALMTRLLPEAYREVTGGQALRPA